MRIELSELFWTLRYLILFSKDLFSFPQFLNNKQQVVIFLAEHFIENTKSLLSLSHTDSEQWDEKFSIVVIKLNYGLGILTCLWWVHNLFQSSWDLMFNNHFS